MLLTFGFLLGMLNIPGSIVTFFRCVVAAEEERVIILPGLSLHIAVSDFIFQCERFDIDWQGLCEVLFLRWESKFL